MGILTKEGTMSEFEVTDRPDTLWKKGRTLGPTTVAVLETATTGKAVRFASVRRARVVRSILSSYIVRRKLPLSVHLHDDSVWVTPKGEE